MHVSWDNKVPLLPRKVIIQNDTCFYIFLSFMVLYSVMLAKWNYCHSLIGYAGGGVNR